MELARRDGLVRTIREDCDMRREAIGGMILVGFVMWALAVYVERRMETDLGIWDFTGVG